MKVKRTSWHYKISNLGNERERSSDNLCRYFWRLVFKSLLFFVIIGYMGIVGYFLFTNICALIIILFVCSSVILPVLAIFFVRQRLGKSPEMLYENIVTEYVKAKKEKVCPIIEYTD